MSKKILALLTAFALLFSVGSALAEKHHMVEDFTEFDVDVVIPEGFEYRQNPQEGWLCLEMWRADGGKPYYDINVSPSEEADGKSLGDFTQEEKDHMEALVSENFSMPSHEYFVTPSGNTILFTRETDPQAGDYATMQTVYKGYFFYLYCGYQDYAPLTEEDIQLMRQITEGVDIIDTGK